MYFGEKIAIYFAWLGMQVNHTHKSKPNLFDITQNESPHFILAGFYTGWLLPAAVVGVLVFLYGVITMNFNQVANEVCTEGHNFKMCPLCGECEDWTLSDICVFKKIAYLFDHPGTVFYAIFMSFWGKY